MGLALRISGQGARRAPRSFNGAGARAALLQTTDRALRLNRAATLRAEAGHRRTDNRNWVSARRERTRHLIEPGGVVQKAGLLDTGDDL